MHWGCYYDTTLDIEVDTQRRRFGCRESDFVGPVREEPGTLTQGGALFSLVPLVWESNPKLQGGWCKPKHQPIG